MPKFTAIKDMRAWCETIDNESSNKPIDTVNQTTENEYNSTTGRVKPNDLG